MNNAMEKEYSVKLYDDSTIEFKLISKDVFDDLVKQDGWKEYPEALEFKSSQPFTKAYTNGTEFIALKKKNIKQNAIYCKDKLFFELLKTAELVFFGERNYNPDEEHFMQMYYNEKTFVLLKNHNIKKLKEETKNKEGYYEIDDGRYMYLFEDGRSEVFMNFRDMEILEDIIG